MTDMITKRIATSADGRFVRVIENHYTWYDRGFLLTYTKDTTKFLEELGWNSKTEEQYWSVRSYKGSFMFKTKQQIIESCKWWKETGDLRSYSIIYR